ncbi:helix-turn-helix domain-containing protein [Collinsella aerofaciens]|uniref:helix-turn-helix domain-containing protein n=1 Tax=Collinsella aerofaciens TaxID=74426 RepID=UPI0006C26518|nr:helix-turn-helix transcriptional regulator [Collinsella aerofaciens]MCC2804150.1 helix-turn-helix domain-containing protein [Collinsella aerofaciens]CUN36408.1 HTH-type transcriptional regulator immR [Collinsella aerofaciens]
MDLAMAQRLVDRRKAAGLSQEALAAQLGVSRQAVSKWERSESSPDTDNLIALAALYGVSLDELLYGEAASDADSSEDGSTETVDEAKEAEDSAEHADCGDKPLVDISLARGIHVIDPNKGEEVHVGWNGIHVTNERKGEEVHVGPDGVHVDTLEDDGHSVHTDDDGTVTIDGETFSSWKEAHDKLDHHGKHFHTKVGRTWNKFPFPALVALAYLVLGIVYGTWAAGLFLVFLIPVYYAFGDFIDQRHLSKLIDVVYSVSAEAWFLYMWLCLEQPHPAWVILITIPVVKALMRWCRKQWKHRERA